MKTAKTYNRTYVKPFSEIIFLGAESAVLQDIFSGGDPNNGIVIDPDPDDSDDDNRTAGFNAWEDLG